MTTPVTPQMFIERGVPAEQAHAMSAEHNSLAGYRADTSPGAPITPAAPRPAQAPAAPPGMSAEQAGAEISAIRARRLAGEIDDRQWRKVFEPRMMELAGVAQALKDYNAASTAQKSAMNAATDEIKLQGDIEQSMDGSMEAAKSPREYVFPNEPKSSEEHAVDSQLREAFYSAGIPQEMGVRIAEDFNATVTALVAAPSAEARAAIVDGNAKALQQRWGTQFDAKVDVVRAFLLAEGQKSPIVRQIVEANFDVLATPAIMQRLYLLAERRQKSPRQ